MPPDPSRGRRDVFADFAPGSTVHLGLWLGRFLEMQTWHHEREPEGYDRERARRARDLLVEQVQHRPLPDGYVAAFEAWRAGFDPDRTVLARVRSRGRVIIGLGAKGATEFGISLHHTWGVPVLPGSSLKGIAALGAHRYLEGYEGRPVPAKAREGGPAAFDVLFGDVEEQGAVVFHDAWLDPAATKNVPLHRDVITVHHPDYYQQDKAPSDTESPIPVPFVSASGGWLVALELAPGLGIERSGSWLEAAWAALRLGLDRHGIGAKTNAGYGRLDLPVWDETTAGKAQRRRAQIAEEREAEERRLAEIERVRAHRLALATPEERVAHVGSLPGGWAALRQWITTDGADEVAGLTLDQAHIVAAVRALFAARQAAGLDAPERLRAWVAEGLAPPPVALAARRQARPDEVERLVQKNTDRKKQIDFNTISKTLVRARLDAESLEVAMARLREVGASSGHLRVLIEDLERARSGD